MRRNIILGLLGVCVALTALFSLAWFKSSRLPYSEEGRYFDPNENVVYQDFTDVYAALSLAGGMFSLGLLAYLLKMRQTSN